MEFSIDLGTPPKAAPPSSAPLYASVDGRVSSLSNGEVVFLDPRTDRLHVMTEQVLSALDLCRPFRSLDQHVGALRQAMPQLAGQGDAIRRVLENLVKRGLLQSDSEFLARYDGAETAAPAPFAGFFVRACDRPAQLQRLLSSLLEHGRRHGHHPVTVVDDSRDPANAREQRRLLQEFGQAAQVEVRHLGTEEWNRAAMSLIGSAGVGAAAQRLLVRAPEQRSHAGGLGVNLILLLAAGRRFGLLDDDFVFPLRLHPEHDPRPDFAAQGGVQARFFADVEAALGAGRDLDDDPIAAHLAACGRTLASVVGRHPMLPLRREDLAGLTPSRAPQLEPSRRIIATSNGHRGHSGSPGSGWLFLLDPNARAALWQQREDYLRQIESPRLWFGASRARLQAQGNFTAFCVDGSRLLPCTRPDGRAEDQLFAALCRFVWPDSLSLQLPFSIGHRQEADRPRTASLRHPFTPRTNDYLSDLASTSAEEFQAVDPTQRLRGLATRMRDLAGASARDRAAMLGEHLARARSSLVAQLQGVLQAARGAPVYWAADLRQLIEANGRALVQPAPPRLGDWPEHLDADGCAERLRQELEQQADALEVWPALWQAAQEQAQAPTRSGR